MPDPNNSDDQLKDHSSDLTSADTELGSKEEVDASASAQIPSRIGQYEIQRVIASGGMGTVFEALQDNPRRPVALKVVKSSLESREAIQRLGYEAQVLARLRHPGIAQIYDAGSYDDRGTPVPFFAMEYIPNARSITRYASDKHLDYRQRLELFLQVCEAVHHGHQRGIVHRDLKPSNILVDSNGRVRVIDFGVARATGADMQQARAQTRVGQLIGSVQYMSPEQFDADPHDIDTRSDVYALGVVLYQLLAGELPYDVTTDSIFDIATEVREGRLRQLSTHDKRLGGELEAIVHKALKKDRENRYQSAFGLAQDIRRYLAGEAVTARPPGLSYQLRVFARRNKALIGIVSAAFVLLVTGIIVTTSLLLRVDAERRRAESESQRATAGREFLTAVLASAVPHGYGDTTTVADVLDSASEKITDAFDDEPEVEAEVRRSLGMAYLNIGRWRQAEQHLAMVLALRKQALGASHDKTIQSIEDLQLAYSVLGNSRGSLELEREWVSAMAQRAGSSDPAEFRGQSAIAYYLEDVGEVGEAQRVAREIWEANSTALGRESEEAFSAQAHYSWLLMKTGRYEEAEELALDALTRSTNALGGEHQVTAETRSAAAAINIAQGKIGEARELYGNRRMPAEIDIEREIQGKFDAKSGPFQLLVFFEEWCPFSQNAMPRAEKTFRQYRLQGLDVIGFTRVNRSSTDDAVRQLLADKDISFTAVKENGRLWNFFNCQGTPSFRLLHNGYLIWENKINYHEPIPLRMVEGMVAAR
jgi:serine/threonine protein kinase